MSRVTSATESTGVCTAKKTASSNIEASLGHGRRRVFGREKQVKVGRVDRALERRLGFVIALLPMLVFDERPQAFGCVIPLRRDLVDVPLGSLQAFAVQVPDPLTPPARVAHQPHT